MISGETTLRGKDASRITLGIASEAVHWALQPSFAATSGKPHAGSLKEEI